jgi:predicted metal-dependent hydrolase
VTYALTRSRRKTLAIHIKPDGSVEVRAPLRLAKSEIERFVASKSTWITKKQAQIAARKSVALRELPTSEYANGEFERVTRELINVWEQQFGVSASFVGIRKMSSRWGRSVPVAHVMRGRTRPGTLHGENPPHTPERRTRILSARVLGVRRRPRVGALAGE